MLGRLDEASAMVERERSAACALDDDEGWANESAAASEERRLGQRWRLVGGGGCGGEVVVGKVARPERPPGSIADPGAAVALTIVGEVEQETADGGKGEFARDGPELTAEGGIERQKGAALETVALCVAGFRVEEVGKSCGGMAVTK